MTNMMKSLLALAMLAGTNAIDCEGTARAPGSAGKKHYILRGNERKKARTNKSTAHYYHYIKDK
jgi:hypothetical protein